MNEEVSQVDRSFKIIYFFSFLVFSFSLIAFSAH